MVHDREVPRCIRPRKENAERYVHWRWADSTQRSLSPGCFFSPFSVRRYQSLRHQRRGRPSVCPTVSKDRVQRKLHGSARRLTGANSRKEKIPVPWQRQGFLISTTSRALTGDGRRPFSFVAVEPMRRAAKTGPATPSHDLRSLRVSVSIPWYLPWIAPFQQQ